MNKTWNKMMKEYMATPKAYWMLGLASKHGSLEVLFGKHQWMVLFYWRKQGFKGQNKSSYRAFACGCSYVELWASQRKISNIIGEFCLKLYRCQNLFLPWVSLCRLWFYLVSPWIPAFVSCYHLLSVVASCWVVMAYLVACSFSEFRCSQPWCHVWIWFASSMTRSPWLHPLAGASYPTYEHSFTCESVRSGRLQVVFHYINHEWCVWV